EAAHVRRAERGDELVEASGAVADGEDGHGRGFGGVARLVRAQPPSVNWRGAYRPRPLLTGAVQLSVVHGREVRDHVAEAAAAAVLRGLPGRVAPPLAGADADEAGAAVVDVHALLPGREAVRGEAIH